MFGEKILIRIIVKRCQPHRFCYYLGGTKDAATGILGEMSKPLSWGMPAEKVGSIESSEIDCSSCSMMWYRWYIELAQLTYTLLGFAFALQSVFSALSQGLEDDILECSIGLHGQ